MPTPIEFTDVLVIGTGAAGLSCALECAVSARVAIAVKSEGRSGATQWAQGGIAGVRRAPDSLECHVTDTLRAGAALCDREVVEATLHQGASAIAKLAGLGMPFTREAGSESDLHLTREGGHQHRRIVHVEDATGKALQETLLAACQTNERIQFHEHLMAVDIVKEDGQAIGAVFLDLKTGKHRRLYAKCVILATGGASSLYLHATHSDKATGDGIAMAWRAGCRVSNLEFTQFHPTSLYHPTERLLLTEAIRGEGGYLCHADGTRFMLEYDARAELAPRDIVARAIHSQMKMHKKECVYLDCRHLGGAFIEKRFPTLFKRCLALGIDMRSALIPVVPAAHYTCGGILTHAAGQTDCPRLFAIGEVACTGLHGANRLASNSLLECLVFGNAAAAHILTSLPAWKALPSSTEPAARTSNAASYAQQMLALQKIMWEKVGIWRTTEELLSAQKALKGLHDLVSSKRMPSTADGIMFLNALLVSRLIVTCALGRRESRGLHYVQEYPQTLATPEDTVLSPVLLKDEVLTTVLG